MSQRIVVQEEGTEYLDEPILRKGLMPSSIDASDGLTDSDDEAHGMALSTLHEELEVDHNFILKVAEKLTDRLCLEEKGSLEQVVEMLRGAPVMMN